MKSTFIKSDPAVMMGKPVVAGTRITVELIVEKLAAGETVEQIIDAHPRLTSEAIKAAQAQQGYLFIQRFRTLRKRMMAESGKSYTDEEVFEVTGGLGKI